LRTIAPDVGRPLRSLVEVALTPLLGTNPPAWQLYAVLVRWLASVGLWWALGQVWPEHNRPVFIAALVYAIYPGFSQQSLALTYHYYWLFQGIFFLSLGAMVWAIRSPRNFRLGLALALAGAAAQLFSSEYLAGLELLRPALIWLALAPALPDWKARLRRTILYSAPFLVILGIYLSWRVFFIRFPTYQPTLIHRLLDSPLHGLAGLAESVLHAFRVVTLGAWGNTLGIDFARFDPGTTAIYALLVVLSTAGLILFLNRLEDKVYPAASGSRARQPVAIQLLGIGLVAFLVAGIPNEVTTLTVGSSFDADRLSLAYILGVGLLLAGLLELLLDPRQGIVLASVLAGLAVGLQFANVTSFRHESVLQKDFAWQLAWRAPALESGTLLVTDGLPFPYTDDEGLTFLVNWTYAPENLSTHLPLAVDALTVRLGNGIPALEPGQPILQTGYKAVDFAGSTDDMIVFVYRPPSCLRLLDPVYDRDLVQVRIAGLANGRSVDLETAALPPLVAAALPLSDPGRIVPDPGQAAAPPAFLFAPEPAHTWCYFFEKADLARQAGDWDTVAALGDLAFDSQYAPADLSEYMVFIEAYARLGRWTKADDLTRAVSAPAPLLDPALCAAWERAGKGSDKAGDHIAAMLQELRCQGVP
jgi:hypothetical protein